MSRTRILQFDRWIGERKYGIYAGIMVAAAIAMIAMQKPLPKGAVAGGQYSCAEVSAAGAAPIARVACEAAAARS
jgi:hypothetical protein